MDQFSIQNGKSGNFSPKMKSDQYIWKNSINEEMIYPKNNGSDLNEDVGRKLSKGIYPNIFLKTE